MSDSLTIEADGAVGLNGAANSAGNATVGSSTIAYQNAGTLKITGVSGNDQFTVNYWNGGNAVLTLPSNNVSSNSVTIETNNVYTSGLTINGAASGGGRLKTTGDGSVALNGYGVGSGFISVPAGSNFINYSYINNIQITGSSGSDSFSVGYWNGGGTVTITTAGSCPGNSVVL